ncbi:hypothetical protein ACGC1H_003112 [Rhizoctonia solani]
MADELDLATSLLSKAVDRYAAICARLRNQYVSGATIRFESVPSEFTNRIIAEYSRVVAYEAEIQYPTAILSQLHNISESNRAVSINRFPEEILTISSIR